MLPIEWLLEERMLIHSLQYKHQLLFGRLNLLSVVQCRLLPRLRFGIHPMLAQFPSELRSGQQRSPLHLKPEQPDRRFGPILPIQTQPQFHQFVHEHHERHLKLQHQCERKFHKWGLIPPASNDLLHMLHQQYDRFCDPMVQKYIALA